MLTFVDSLSLAGDRSKQNDDAFGVRGDRAWIIDGATDLHDTPLTGAASDAAWIANIASRHFHQAEGVKDGDPRLLVAGASAAAGAAFRHVVRDQPYERWQSPIASLLMLVDAADGVRGLDLGDCRVFASDAQGAVFIHGGHDGGADQESALAAQQRDKDKPLLQRADTLAMLREQRARQNGGGGGWTFGLDPGCAQHARVWRMPLARPAHLLLMTDGFSALTDRYHAYGAGDLVAAALEQGLHDLARELRAIENADLCGDRHPRFKKSDDATALLLRLT